MLRVAEHAELTDTGRARRANEDHFLVRAPLFVVADGMGGAQAGEVASRLAAETFADGLGDGDSLERRLAARVEDANRRIHRRAREDRARAGMGTTLTAVYVDDEELVVAHVGDSRAYLWRDGELTRLTRDHSLVDELVRRGKLTEEEAAEHPQRSIITRALGPEPDVEVDTRTYRGRDGDVLLLCSDGLTSMISEDDVAALLRDATDLDAAARALVDAANDAGGRDNITVVLARLEEVAGAVGDDGEQPTRAHAGPVGGRAVGEAPTVEQRRARPTPAAGAAPAVVAAERRHAARGHQPLPRRVKVIAAVISTAIVLALVGIAGMFATRAVFFIGTNDHGMVTVYRGLPFELPAGIALYSEYSVSGVPAVELPAERRERLLDHQLRSRSDVRDLIAQLERGTLSP